MLCLAQERVKNVPSLGSFCLNLYASGKVKPYIIFLYKYMLWPGSNIASLKMQQFFFKNEVSFYFLKTQTCENWEVCQSC